MWRFWIERWYFVANLEVNAVEPEQGIVEYGYKNVKQFDLTAFYNEHLIASLWQDEEENWHWTKRLYDIGTVEDVDIEYLDDKSLKGIISDFLVRVRDWIDDEESYLHGLKLDIVEEDLVVVID